MPLVGIIAKKKDIKAIKKDIKEKSKEIIEITNESIKNIKNIKFEQIIFLENINLDEDQYSYMKEIMSNAKFVVINGDIKIDILQKINIDKPIKLITLGFNSKSTITISSVTDEKIIVYIQKEIEKNKDEILERQEKEIICKGDKKIYNNLAVFIINELHNA